ACGRRSRRRARSPSRHPPHRGQGSRLARMADATGPAHTRRRALARAARGTTLSIDETEALLGARGEDLVRLMAIAARLRDLGWADVVTYSRKVFIPLTM